MRAQSEMQNVDVMPSFISLLSSPNSSFTALFSVSMPGTIHEKSSSRLDMVFKRWKEMMK